MSSTGKLIPDSQIQRLLVSPMASLREAVHVVDRGGIQVALVVDDSGCLIGLLSDGDIRRALLSGVTLENATEQAMRAEPRVIKGQTSLSQALRVMQQKRLRHLPFVSSSGKVVGLAVSAALFGPGQVLESSVLIMAGGRGLRLGEITKSQPKPMVSIGDKPLLQTLVEKCATSGFRQCYISVGYLKEQIQAHFGDGTNWGIPITYLEEEEPLGTAGALGLLPGELTSNLVVVNGDVLTSLDFSSLLAFHNDRGAFVTMGVREHAIQIPFGVVESYDFSVTAIREKPIVNNFVSAGIYVLQPEAIGRVRPSTYLDMPDLIQDVLADGYEVSAFPLHEDWIDIGSPETLETARTEWSNRA